MKENAHTFPFFFLDNHEVLDLNGIDLPSHLKLLESYDFKSKLKGMPNLQENLINNLDGYIIYSQCSNTSTGGVRLYGKENLDHLIRYDSSIVEDEFETIWIEIKNVKGQNILCACSYRHPNTCIKKYIEYMDKPCSRFPGKVNLFL